MASEKNYAQLTKKMEDARILCNFQVLPDYWQMDFEAPALAERAKSGQFVMIRVGNSLDPVLRRPMGLNIIDKEHGVLGIIYQIVGRGTKLLTQYKAGDKLSVSGPWGNGWSVNPNYKKVALVGGGAGAAPLLPLAHEYYEAQCQMDIFLGATHKKRLLNDEVLSELGQLYIATLDGSLGQKAMVHEILPPGANYDMVYTCGPNPMMARVSQWAQREGIPCQVSLEERMGCGIGTCMGCVCECQDDSGAVLMKRICRQGPVFDSREVVFHV